MEKNKAKRYNKRVAALLVIICALLFVMFLPQISTGISAFSGTFGYLSGQGVETDAQNAGMPHEKPALDLESRSTQGMPVIHIPANIPPGGIGTDPIPGGAFPGTSDTDDSNQSNDPNDPNNPNKPQTPGDGDSPVFPTKPKEDGLFTISIPNSLALHRNASGKLTATLSDGRAAMAVKWASSAPEIASVDQAGNVTGKGIGKALITASTLDSSDSCLVTVDAPITSLDLEDTYISVHRDGSVPLPFKITPSDTTEDISTIQITSNKPNIADVVDGQIVAKGIGHAEISIRSKDCAAYCQVYVDAPMTGVGLSKSKATIHRGEDLELGYTVYPTDTTESYFTSGWVSKNPEIASVDSRGKITAHKLGSTEIVLTCNKFTATCSVTVDAPIQGVAVSPERGTVHRGETAVLTPSILPADTTQKPVYTWSSSDPKIVSVDESGNVTALSKGTAAITVECQGFKATSTILVDAPVKSISIDPGNSVIHRGETLNLSPVIDPVDTTDPTDCTWTSSKPDVATVDSSGKVTGVQLGTTEITLTIGSFTAKCQITVDAPLEGISLTPTTTIHRGESAALTPVLTPADTTSTLVYAWTSSDESVATVDGNGKVTAVQKGTATITVDCNGFKATCDVTVDAPIKSISISPSDSVVHRGTDLQLSAVINPADTTDSTACTWASSKPGVATVDSTGKVTAVQLGTSEITLRVGSFTAKCQITVDAPLQGIALAPTATIHRGESAALTPTLTPADTTDTLVYAWTSSDEGVATVDGSGKVAAVQKGTATITVDCNGFKATCDVTVDAPIKSISIAPGDSVVHRGTDLQLSAVINPTDTTDPTNCTWTSSKPGVATVDSTGKVTGVQLGTTEITLRIGSFTAKRQITVDAPLQGIGLTPTTTIHRGENATLTPILTPADTTDTLVYTWTSSNPGVATVDGSGKVTAVQKGTATITVDCNGFKATCDVTVDAPIKSISISPSDSVVHRGTDLQLSAVINPADTTDSTACTWASSKPGVATVDSTGKVTGVQLGTTEITLRIGSFTAKCQITVDAPLQGIALTPTATIHRGESTTLMPVLTPADTTDTLVYVWTSSDESVATVDGSGKVTAVQKGIATITVDCNGFKATCDVTVDAPIKSISIAPGDSVVHRGTDLQLSAVINPSDTTDPTNCTWAFSNPSVATIDSTGKVTGVQLGTTEITLRIGSFTTKCQITVDAPLQGIGLAPTATIHRGESATLTPTLTPADTTSTLVYAWTTSNPSVATVDGNGKVTAVQKGTATITVDCNGFKTNCAVTVDAPIQSVAVSPTSLTLYKGGTSALAASVTPADTTEAAAITWSSDNADIATVASNGQITAVSPGTVTIWANSVRGLRAGCTVTVKDVYSISVSGTNGSVTASKTAVREGESVTLTATPNSGYKFTGWKNTATGAIVSTVQIYSFIPTGNMSLEGVFAPLIINVGDDYKDFGGYDWTVVNKDTDGNLTLMCNESVTDMSWNIGHADSAKIVDRWMGAYEYAYTYKTVYNYWASSHIRTWLNSNSKDPINCCGDTTGPKDMPGFLNRFSANEVSQMMPVEHQKDNYAYKYLQNSSWTQQSPSSTDYVWVPTVAQIYGLPKYTNGYSAGTVNYSYSPGLGAAVGDCTTLYTGGNFSRGYDIAVIKNGAYWWSPYSYNTTITTDMSQFQLFEQNLDNSQKTNQNEVRIAADAFKSFVKQQFNGQSIWFSTIGIESPHHYYTNEMGKWVASLDGATGQVADVNVSSNPILSVRPCIKIKNPVT